MAEGGQEKINRPDPSAPKESGLKPVLGHWGNFPKNFG